MDFFKLADMITPTLGVEKHYTSDVITLPKRLYCYSKGARGKLIFWWFLELLRATSPPYCRYPGRGGVAKIVKKWIFSNLLIWLPHYLWWKSTTLGMLLRSQNVWIDTLKVLEVSHHYYFFCWFLEYLRVLSQFEKIHFKFFTIFVTTSDPPRIPIVRRGGGSEEL